MLWVKQLSKMSSQALDDKQFKKEISEFYTIEKETGNHSTVLPKDACHFIDNKKKKKGFCGES